MHSFETWSGPVGQPGTETGSGWRKNRGRKNPVTRLTQLKTRLQPVDFFFTKTMLFWFKKKKELTRKTQSKPGTRALDQAGSENYDYMSFPVIINWWARFFFFKKKRKRKWLGPVWECGCGCFSKCFSCRNASKWYFFYFLKIIFEIITSKRSNTYKKINF